MCSNKGIDSSRVPFARRGVFACSDDVASAADSVPVPFRFRSGSVQVPFRFRAPPGAAFFACFYEVASAANRVQVPLRFRSLGAALLLAFTVLPALPIPFRFRSGPAPPAQRFCLLLRCCQRCRFRSGSVQVPFPWRSAFLLVFTMLPALPIPFRLRAGSVQVPLPWRDAFLLVFTMLPALPIPFGFRSGSAPFGAPLLLAFTMLPALPIPFRFRSGSAPLGAALLLAFTMLPALPIPFRFRSGSAQVPLRSRSPGAVFPFACFYDVAGAANSVQAPCRLRSGSAPLARRFFCLFSRCCQRCRFRSGSVQVPPPRRSAFACFYDAASAADSVQAPFRFRPPWRSARKSSMDSWRARSYPLCSNRERRFTCNIISSAAPAAVPNAWMGDWELDPQLKQESRRCPVPQFPDSQLNGSQFPIHAECRTDRAMKNVIVLWRGRHQAIDLIMTTTIQQFDCADHRGAGHVII